VRYPVDLYRSGRAGALTGGDIAAL